MRRTALIGSVLVYAYLRSIPPALPCLVVGPNAPDPTCRP
jgi:hypothetical protein